METTIQLSIIWLTYVFLFYREFIIKNPVKQFFNHHQPAQNKTLFSLKLISFFLIPIGATLWFYMGYLLPYPLLFMLGGLIGYYLIDFLLTKKLKETV